MVFRKGIQRRFIRKPIYSSQKQTITRAKLRRSLNDVRKLKKIVRKDEVKEFIVSASTQTSGGLTGLTTSVSNTGIGVMPTFNPASGDGSNERTGNRILVKWIKFRFRIETGDQDGMRLQLISPETGIPTVNATAIPSDFLSIPQMDSTYNSFKVISDRSFMRTMSNPDALFLPRQLFVADYVIPVNKVWVFQSGTQAVPIHAPGIVQFNWCGTNATVTDSEQFNCILGFTDA